MRERCKELFHLRVTLLLAPRVVEQCHASTNQRNNQNATFPKQHLIVTMKLNRALEIRLIDQIRSEEHTSELQSQSNLVCRLLLEKKKKKLYHDIMRAPNSPRYTPTMPHYTTISTSLE